MCLETRSWSSNTLTPLMDDTETSSLIKNRFTQHSILDTGISETSPHVGKLKQQFFEVTQKSYLLLQGANTYMRNTQFDYSTSSHSNHKGRLGCSFHGDDLMWFSSSGNETKSLAAGENQQQEFSNIWQLPSN